MKRWPALDLSTTGQKESVPPGWEDLLSAALDGLEPTAILEQDSGWRVFFASAGARDRAAGELPSLVGGWVSLAAVDVPDEDWARRSQDALQPVRVGRITLSPPWAAGTTAGTDIEVVILPSMGFGTGHHASTRLCTALLQEIELDRRRVLDVGTGSGVLALVALRLGASEVLGIDDDADAIASARDNLALNGVQGPIELRQSDFRVLDDLRADVVTANLTGALLARSAAQLAGAVLPGGSLIVSGVTLEEETSVTAALVSHLALASRIEESGWVGLRFGR